LNESASYICCHHGHRPFDGIVGQFCHPSSHIIQGEAPRRDGALPTAHDGAIAIEELFLARGVDVTIIDGNGDAVVTRVLPNDCLQRVINVDTLRCLEKPNRT
jgi:hypothetical protein